MRRHASTRAGSGAATAAALIVSPYLSATLTRAPGKSFNPLCTMASNTGCVSVSELLMTLQDFGRRRLLLQRLGQLARARLLGLEQPRVLDGDDGLVGEGLHQLDLPFAEGSAPRAARS